MPVQHFAQPTASTIDTEQPITEIRWDFGYESVEILESGNVIARINDPNILLSSGIDITANSGVKFVLHVKKDTSAGPFTVFRNNVELVGGIPSWGIATSVAGKMVHLPTDLYQLKESIRTKLERPVRISQSWIGFLSLSSLVFAYLSGLGSRFVPVRFLSSVETPLFSGAVAALGFMTLALAIQKRTAFFLLPIAQIFTIVQGVFIGNTLFDAPDYPHFAGFRLFVSALALWVMADSWKTIRGHRAEVREARKQNRIGLNEIEKTTVRDLEKVAAERGHLLTWQKSMAEAVADNKVPDPAVRESSPTFPTALDLLSDGTDPFVDSAVPQATSPTFAATSGWSSRPASMTLAPAPTPLITPATSAVPVAAASSRASPSATASAFTTAVPTFSSAIAGLRSNALEPTSLPERVPTDNHASMEPVSSVSNQATALAAVPRATSGTRFGDPQSALLANLPIEPTGLTLSRPQSWTPPAQPIQETEETAKPQATNHPLRSKVRSGL